MKGIVEFSIIIRCSSYGGPVKNSFVGLSLEIPGGLCHGTLTSSAVDLLGRDGRVFEVHCEVGRYLQVDQRYGGERHDELGYCQADSERLLGHAGRPFLDARLVQPDGSDVDVLNVLVQQQRHHGREWHHPDEHQRLGHAAPEHRAPGVPDNREVPAGRDGKQIYNLSIHIKCS